MAASLLTAAFLSAPTGADAGPTSMTGTGDRWFAIRYTANGGEVLFDADLTVNDFPFGWGLDGWHADDLATSLGNFSIVLDQGFAAADVQLQLAEGIGTSHAVELDQTQDDRFRFAVRHDAQAFGTFVLLIWWAGELDWTWNVTADPAVEILGITTGQSAFLLDQTDFQGTLSANVAAHAKVALGIDTSATLQVDHALIAHAPPYLTWWSSCAGAAGQYACFNAASPDHGGYNGLSVTRPDGQSQECKCIFSGFGGPSQPGAGRYVFHSDTQYIDFIDIENHVFGVIDPILPP